MSDDERPVYDAADYELPAVSLDNIVGYRIYSPDGVTIYRWGWAPDVVAIDPQTGEVIGLGVDKR